MNLPISPLSLDPLTRDTWGAFDAAAIRQLAPLADDLCYRPRLYKSPDSPSEVMPANGYVSHGLKITPGSLIYGFYLPAEMVGASGGEVPPNLTAVTPPQFNVQITDTSLGHKFFDEPVPSLFLANFKPTYYSAVFVLAGSFPNLLCAPYPVVGSGLFMVELWNTAGYLNAGGAFVGVSQRVELVIGTLEPLPAGEEGCQ
jgi:hypothetical protein